MIIIIIIKEKRMNYTCEYWRSWIIEKENENLYRERRVYKMKIN